MALLPPIIAPVSVLTEKVLIEGIVDAATLSVLMEGVDGRPILLGQATAVAPSHRMLMAPGSLVADRRIWATQERGQEHSIAQARDEMEVIAAVGKTLPPPFFAVDPIACGLAVHVEGLTPGTEVVVTEDAGGGKAGATLAVVTEWDYRVVRTGLNAPVQENSTLLVSQRAPKLQLVSDTGRSAPALRLPPGPGRTISAPVLSNLPAACNTYLDIEGLLHGVEVSVTHAGSNLKFRWPDSAVHLNLPFALTQGAELRLQQSVGPKCEVGGVELVTKVGPMIAPKPEIVEPLCAGMTLITVKNLESNARLRLTYGGKQWEGRARIEEKEDGGKEVPLGTPLDTGTLIVSQEHCGRWISSNLVPINPAPTMIQPPQLLNALFECARCVRVENLRLNQTVRLIVSSVDGAKATYLRQAQGPFLDVTVSALRKGDSVAAEVKGCGKLSARVERKVQPEPAKVPDPIVQPLDECDTIARVAGVIPGATVHVYVDDREAGALSCGSLVAGVKLDRRIYVGQKVKAWQQLCLHGDAVRRFGPETEVKENKGIWKVLSNTSGNENIAEVLAIHAALLPSGNIIYFGGDQFSIVEQLAGRWKNTRLFNCRTYLIEQTGSPDSDSFCAGHALLSDGRLLVVGGISAYAEDEGGTSPPVHQHHFPGHDQCWIYDGGSRTWAHVASTSPVPGTGPGTPFPAVPGGRWYPTITTLADGRALALGGHPAAGDTGRHINDTVEVYTPDADFSKPGQWMSLGRNSEIGPVDDPEKGTKGYYPRLHMVRGGVVSTSSMGGATKRWAVGSSAMDWQTVALEPSSMDDPRQSHLLYVGSYSCSSVLLPLAPPTAGQLDYTFDLLVCGAPVTYRMRLGEGQWRKATQRSDGGGSLTMRQNCSAVLLPTGEVFLCGGVDPDPNKQERVPTLVPEVYDPTTAADLAKGLAAGSWRTWNPASVTRDYHSVALLMPDGRVWTAGGDHEASKGLENRELRIEIFEPWYCRVPRPQITAAPQTVAYGESFNITCNGITKNTRAALIRVDSSTHAFNGDQRYVHLALKSVSLDPANTGSGTITVQAPAGLPGQPPLAVAEVAPPGYYLLFVLSADEGQKRLTPSEGAFVRLGAK